MDGRQLAGSWPRFADPFMTQVANGFAKRRKSLRNRGTFRAYGPTDDDPMEWLTLTHELTSRRVVVLQLAEKNRASLYVRSTKGENRGKVLLRIEDMRLMNKPSAIVAAYEKTLSEAGHSEAAELRAAIERHWKPIWIQVVDQ